MIAFHGFLVVDKPQGITSRRALNRVLKCLPRGTRIGHAGTLDPLATGVLVVAIGRATRLIEYVQPMEKGYHAVITFGGESDTDDADGKITPRSAVEPPSRESVLSALATFQGEISQVPPAYSAAKVDGRRAHHLARRGRDVDLAPRQVTVHEIHALDYAYPRLEISVRCGKGTYIRSLARDLGRLLGCGGYIEQLKRTRVGPFTLAEAAPLDALPSPMALLPLEWGVPQASIELNDKDIDALSNGRVVYVSSEMTLPQESAFAVYDTTRRLRTVATWDKVRRVIRAVKVFKELA